MKRRLLVAATTVLASKLVGSPTLVFGEESLGAEKSSVNYDDYYGPVFHDDFHIDQPSHSQNLDFGYGYYGGHHGSGNRQKCYPADGYTSPRGCRCDCECCTVEKWVPTYPVGKGKGYLPPGKGYYYPNDDWYTPPGKGNWYYSPEQPYYPPGKGKGVYPPPYYPPGKGKGIYSSPGKGKSYYLYGKGKFGGPSMSSKFVCSCNCQCKFPYKPIRPVPIRPVPSWKPKPVPTPWPTHKRKRKTPMPTRSPTKYPTPCPTEYPTHFPTKYPTHFPTKYPTHSPTPRKKHGKPKRKYCCGQWKAICEPHRRVLEEGIPNSENQTKVENITLEKRHLQTYGDYDDDYYYPDDDYWNHDFDSGYYKSCRWDCTEWCFFSTP